jgi:hypothetical protein
MQGYMDGVSTIFYLLFIYSKFWRVKFGSNSLKSIVYKIWGVVRVTMFLEFNFCRRLRLAQFRHCIMPYSRCSSANYVCCSANPYAILLILYAVLLHTHITICFMLWRRIVVLLILLMKSSCVHCIMYLFQKLTFNCFVLDTTIAP